MDSETEDVTPKVTQSESEDVHIYGSFGADPVIASSEAFQALKNAYEHLKQKHHGLNEKCTALKLDAKILMKENERLRQSYESGERNTSFDISSEAVDKNKIYLLQTKIEELTLERNKLQSLLTSYKQSIDLPGSQHLTECQSSNCQKQIKSLEKINKDLILDTKQQEFKIQTLKTQLKNQNTGEQSAAEGVFQGDIDMETDGNDEHVGNTDLVEFDVEHFLSDYRLLKSEVSSLLLEVNTYRELNQAGMLHVGRRKPLESDFEMEDYEETAKRDTESVLTRFGQGIASSGIKRPPKEEFGSTSIGQISPTLSDEDLYGASTSSKYSSGLASSSSKYGQGLGRATATEGSRTMIRHMSSSYGPTTDIQARHRITNYQPGSAPNFPTSGRKTSPSALFIAQSSPRGSGSQVSNQGSDFKFQIPIMQETGEGLLPPRNPPDIEDAVHVGGRNSPDLFTPAEEKRREESEQGDITAIEPQWTPCPICSRQFDRSLFSAEYINQHVNSHFDGSSEYEFVDILQ